MPGMFGSQAPQGGVPMALPGGVSSLPDYAQPGVGQYLWNWFSGISPQQTDWQAQQAYINGVQAQQMMALRNARVQQMQAQVNGQGQGQGSGGDPSQQSNPYAGILPPNQEQTALNTDALVFGPDYANAERENYTATRPNLPTGTLTAAPVFDTSVPGGYRTNVVPGGIAATSAAAAMEEAARQNANPNNPNVVIGPGPGGQLIKTLVGTAAGQPQAIGQLAGATAQAQEQAKAATDLVPIIDPETGKTQYYRRSDLLAANGGNSGSGGSSNGAPTPVITGGAPFGQQTHYENAEKNYQQIISDGNQAGDQVNQLQALGQVLDQSGSGKLNPALNDIGGYAQALGLPDPTGKGWNKLTNAQAAQTINASLMGQLRSQMGFVRMTNQDMNYIQHVLPSLGNTPQANKIIINYLSAIAQRKALRGQWANNWRSQYGSLAAKGANHRDFDGEWATYNASNPLSVMGQ